MVLVVAGLGWPAQMLGLRPPTHILLAVVLGVAPLAAFVSLILLAHLKSRTPLFQEALRKYRHLVSMHPRTRQERLLFVSVCATAGICEEALYRGFLPAYVMRSFPGMGFFLAIVLSALVFGFAHSWQKGTGIVLNGIMGLLYESLYGVTSSILPCILLHALFDLRVLVDPLTQSASPAEQSKGDLPSDGADS